MFCVSFNNLTGLAVLMESAPSPALFQINKDHVHGLDTSVECDGGAKQALFRLHCKKPPRITL
jgi:hypothetical protein